MVQAPKLVFREPLTGGGIQEHQKHDNRPAECIRESVCLRTKPELRVPDLNPTPKRETPVSAIWHHKTFQLNH